MAHCGDDGHLQYLKFITICNKLCEVDINAMSSEIIHY